MACTFCQGCEAAGGYRRQAKLSQEAARRAHHEPAAGGERGAGGESAASQCCHRSGAASKSALPLFAGKTGAETLPAGPGCAPTPIKCSAPALALHKPAIRSPALPNADRPAGPPEQTAGGATAAWPLCSFKPPSALWILCCSQRADRRDDSPRGVREAELIQSRAMVRRPQRGGGRGDNSEGRQKTNQALGGGVSAQRQEAEQLDWSSWWCEFAGHEHAAC